MQSKLIEALHLAKEVLNICGGDAWERECSESSRCKFEELYEELFPTPKKEEFIIKRWEWTCTLCGITMPKGNEQTHINGKKHKRKIATQQSAEAVINSI